MAERFRSLGWESKLDRAGNVVAWLPGRREQSGVAVTAHLDTVLAPRAPEDIKVGPDGRLQGPGVSDNGAGLAALLALAAAWTSAPPLDDPVLAPVLIANVGEEGEGNLCGMRYICRNGASLRYRAFLVLDGPNLDHITCEALASRRFDVAFSGPGGHSWSDHGAANPVHALSRAITRFLDEAPEGEPRCSYNFGLIEGGTSINAIPSEAHAKVDLRSQSPRRMDELASLLESAVQRVLEEENTRASGRSGGRPPAARSGNGRALSAKLKEIGSRPGGEVRAGSPILDALLAVDTHLGIRSSLDCASTDANIPLSLGIPAVSIGAGGQGAGAHTTAEWFSPEGRELGLRRILLAVCLLLGEAA